MTLLYGIVGSLSLTDRLCGPVCPGDILWLGGLSGPGDEPAKAAAVGSIAAAFHRNATGAGYVGCLGTLFSFYNIKLHRFAISNTAEEFTGVVPLDCGLMHKHILLGIIPVYKSIAITDIEPFHCALHLGGCR